MSAKAECTWGDGPDVLVVVAGINISGFSLSQHANGDHSFGLTSDEAKHLAAQLLTSAERADELDRSYFEHCKAHQEPET